MKKKTNMELAVCMSVLLQVVVYRYDFLQFLKINKIKIKGLESLSTHLYRLVLPTDNGQLTSKWISVLTTKEPVTADYLTRACRSAGKFILSFFHIL